MTDRSASRAPGDVVDHRYRLKREIARGGMGVIFEAEHLFTGNTVALKTLDPDAVVRRGNEQRLFREAQVLAQVPDPGVVAVLDAGRCEIGGPYLAMELLEGRSLAGLLVARQRLGVEQSVRIGRQVALTLAAVHRLGVLHRDVNPSNLFVARRGDVGEVVKLLDFGLAFRPSSDARITQTGSAVGTVYYMAPEQLQDRQLDHRCDIYGLGATLYECISGQVPFVGSPGEAAVKITTEEAPPLHEVCPEVSESLSRVIATALARDPERRHADGRAFAAALAEAHGAASTETSLLSFAGSPALPESNGTGHDSDAPIRRYPRVPYVTPVRLVLSDGSLNDGHSEEIGEGGMLVLVERWRQGTESVEVRVALPQSGRVVELGTIQRWLKSGRRPAAVAGLEFRDLPPAVHDEIRSFVASSGRVVV